MSETLLYLCRYKDNGSRYFHNYYTKDIDIMTYIPTDIRKRRLERSKKLIPYLEMGVTLKRALSLYSAEVGISSSFRGQIITTT